MGKLGAVLRILLMVAAAYIALVICLQVFSSFRHSSRLMKTTPLARAAAAGDAVKIRELLANGAAVDEKNGKGETPLMLAVIGSKAGAVDALLAAGADVNAANSGGASVAALSVQYGNPDTLVLLLDRGAHMDSKDFLGDPLLFCAAYHGSAAMVRLLLGRGAKPLGLGYHGTILQHAVYGKSPEVFKLLIAGGADINAADKWGETPLMTAAREGDLSVTASLLGLGAKTGARNEGGKTACDIAAEYKHAPVEKLLCSR